MQYVKRLRGTNADHDSMVFTKPANIKAMIVLDIFQTGVTSTRRPKWFMETGQTIKEISQVHGHLYYNSSSTSKCPAPFPCLEHTHTHTYTHTHHTYINTHTHTPTNTHTHTHTHTHTQTTHSLSLCCLCCKAFCWSS